MKIGSASCNLERAYPEYAAGGFSRANGYIDFYTRINALLRSDMIVLDLGAGRGAQFSQTGSPFKINLIKIQGKVKRLVGVDVDPLVKENAFLDEARIIEAGGRLPFEDETFDLIYADWVLEHVASPETFAREVRRVLKPGGWFCARTPNRWGLTGMGATLIPNRSHTRLLKILQPERHEQDVFPTTYKLNTRRSLRRYFQPAQWEHHSYIHNPDPPYVQRSLILMRLVQLLFRLTPEVLATNVHVFLRKR